MFCKSNEQKVTERAEALQPIACEAMLTDFSDCDAHPDELRQEGHVFSRHFRHTSCEGPPIGLQALAAAADVAVQDQTRLNDSGFTTGSSARDPMIGMDFQSQFPGITTNMTGSEQNVFGSTLLSDWQSGPRLEAAGFNINSAATPALLPTAGDTGNWDYDNFFMNWGFE
jgi:hypothetical protein